VRESAEHDRELAELRRALRSGGLAILPTDTVYGLAAWLEAPRAVEALYALKGRERSEPCQVLLCAPGLLGEALSPLGPATRAAAAALLPGPATCLVPDPAGRYAAAAGDRPGGVGLRAPRIAGPLARLDLPLVATSANRPGGSDPASLADVPGEMLTAAAAIVDAGPLPGVASAVVDLRPLEGGGPALLLRPGPDPAGLERALAAVGAGVVRPP
jgi:L-threonylcarbamoyladenylate synthase